MTLNLKKTVLTLCAAVSFSVGIPSAHAFLGVAFMNPMLVAVGIFDLALGQKWSPNDSECPICLGLGFAFLGKDGEVAMTEITPQVEAGANLTPDEKLAFNQELAAINANLSTLSKQIKAGVESHLAHDQFIANLRATVSIATFGAYDKVSAFLAATMAKK